MNCNFGVDTPMGKNALVQFVDEFINSFAQFVREFVSGVDGPSDVQTIVVWLSRCLCILASQKINRCMCLLLQVYLCAGYYTHVHNTNYVITWTTPHCVLTLRLIGLAFDVYDGHRRTVSQKTCDEFPLNHPQRTCTPPCTPLNGSFSSLCVSSVLASILLGSCTAVA